jgi:hypothetical protein
MDAFRIYSHDPVPVCFFSLVKPADARYAGIIAGIIKENIDSPEALDDDRAHRFPIAGSGDIRAKKKTGITEVSSNSLCAFPIPINHRHPRTLGGKGPCGCLPNPRTCTSADCCFALQSHVSPLTSTRLHGRKRREHGRKKKTALTLIGQGSAGRARNIKWNAAVARN